MRRNESSLAMSRGLQVRFGIERMTPGDRPRHRHGAAYATIVLAGSFEQSGYFGRYRLQPGDVLIQPTLDAHSDRHLSGDLEILRLPWAFDATDGHAIRIPDVDLLRRAAERDVHEASAMLESQTANRTVIQPLLENEADVLAWTFARRRGVSISQTSQEVEVSREWLSRLFCRTYGICPATFRRELLARAAWRGCLLGEGPLSELAAELGYADQAHMTREVHRLTGSSPGSWRKWSRALPDRGRCFAG